MAKPKREKISLFSCQKLFATLLLIYPPADVVLLWRTKTHLPAKRMPWPYGFICCKTNHKSICDAFTTHEMQSFIGLDLWMRYKMAGPPEISHFSQNATLKALKAKESRYPSKTSWVAWLFHDCYFLRRGIHRHNADNSKSSSSSSSIKRTKSPVPLFILCSSEIMWNLHPTR